MRLYFTWVVAVLFLIEITLTTGSIEMIETQEVRGPNPNNTSDRSSYMAPDRLFDSPRIFTENQGQLTNGSIKFYDRSGSVWFTENGVWFDLREGSNDVRETSSAYEKENYHEGVTQRRGSIVKQEFIMCNPTQPVGADYVGWNSNFFYGKDPNGWKTNVPNWREVWYRDLWNGIDLRYYLKDGGLKYDLIVRPGSRVSDIRIDYKGAQAITLEEKGNLTIHTSSGDLNDADLFIYQNERGQVKEIQGGFTITDGTTIGYEISGEYDPNILLVIDPSIVYSTFLGGSGFDSPGDVVLDESGNAYVTGCTQSPNFPTTPGAYDITYGGLTWDVSVTKIDPTGSTLLYSTYLGGGQWELGNSIAINDNGEAFVTGDTLGIQFPTTPGAFDSTPNGGNDAFVFKLSQNGATLIYSTLIGGSAGDIGYSIALNGNDSAIICGETSSSNYPTTPNAFDTGFNSQTDVFVTQLNSSGTGLVYSTFIGGPLQEVGYAISIDQSNGLYLTGKTISSQFPTTQGAYGNSHNGDMDVFVMKFDITNWSIQYSTFIGGSFRDVGYGITADTQGDAYITGYSQSPNSSAYPTTVGAFDTTYNGMKDIFVTKLNWNGSSLVYSTFLGGFGHDEGTAICVDLSGCAIITGNVYSSQFPTTLTAYDTTHNGQSDAIIVRLTQDGSGLHYSTFIGSISNSVEDSGTALTINSIGDLVLAGLTKSNSFPTTNGAYDTSHNGFADGYVLKLLLSGIQVVSVSVLKGSEPVSKLFTRLCSYTFRVKVHDTMALTDVEKVSLTIPFPTGDVKLHWLQITDKFEKQDDNNDHIVLNSSSAATEGPYQTWTIDFNVTFNWNSPEDQQYGLFAQARSFVYPPAYLNKSDVFSIENDLDFIGSLSVSDGFDQSLDEEELVGGGSIVKWSGLTVVYENMHDVYPPDEEYDVTIQDNWENEWVNSPGQGEEFFAETTVPTEDSIESVVSRFVISKVPPENDVSNVSFMLRVDSANVTFSDPTPDRNMWQTSEPVKVGVKMSDLGGGLVDGETVMVAISSDNGSTWGNWHNIPQDSAQIIKVVTTLGLTDGKENLVKWSALDSFGNGPSESPAYPIIVDTEDPVFTEPVPSAETVSATENVTVGITIEDAISGVNASTIEYTISVTGGTYWTDWLPIYGLIDGNSVVTSIELLFSNGTQNMVKWRAFDLAGNGPAESPAFPVIVNTWVAPEKPMVVLTAPEDGSLMQSLPILLSWDLTFNGTGEVEYEVHLSQGDPPKKVIAEHHKGLTLSVDQLNSGTTYHWTVIPKTDSITGICLSGIWSFRLTEVPHVTPISPPDGHEMENPSVELVWQPVGDGVDWVYEVYLDLVSPPKKLWSANHTTTSIEIEELEAGKTYYWTVVPINTDGIRGPDLEFIWDFQIETPTFFGVAVDPIDEIYIKPGNEIEVTTMVYNTGNQNDSFVGNLRTGDLFDQVVFNSSSILIIGPDQNLPIEILVSVFESTPFGDYEIEVMMISQNAKRNGLEVSDNITFIVHVVSEEGVFQEETSPESENGTSIDMIIIFIIIVIIILAMILLNYLFKKRSEKGDNEGGEPEVLPGKANEQTVGVIQKIESQPDGTELKGDHIPSAQTPFIPYEPLQHNQISTHKPVKMAMASAQPQAIPKARTLPSDSEIYGIIEQIPKAKPILLNETESGTN